MKLMTQWMDFTNLLIHVRMTNITDSRVSTAMTLEIIISTEEVRRGRNKYQSIWLNNYKWKLKDKK